MPLVAIVGRPNVGKSTLFNRLTGSRRSIVGDEPGITRDRIYGEYEWLGRQFRLVDTGGIVPDDPELIPHGDFQPGQGGAGRSRRADPGGGRADGAGAARLRSGALLQRGGKPLFLAVNKVEGEAMGAAAENFRRLGIRERVPISSEHGLGIGDLLDAIAEAIPATARVAERRQSGRGRRGDRDCGRKPGKIQRTRCPSIARMASLSSTKLRWRLSGGRTWASPRC